MNMVVKLMVGLIVVFQLLGCASKPVAIRSPIINADAIKVSGYVRIPGYYLYHEGMTAADALDLARGYGNCTACRQGFEEMGSHPSYDAPPKIRRDGEL